MEQVYWRKAIVLLDMDAFYAAVEILDNPALKDQPVSVTNGAHGSTIITCSYVARKYGIHTGMPLYKAKLRCKNLINIPARHKRYNYISNNIMSYLREYICPDIEVYSVDEAFIDITGIQRSYGPIKKIAQNIQKQIYTRFGLEASLGISGDKTTAKYAAKNAKPFGIKIVEPKFAGQYLANAHVTDICGISNKIAKFLLNYGIEYCRDMHKLPQEILTQKFGVTGKRIWYMCQGLDQAQVKVNESPAKTMGHGKVLPPNTNNKDKIIFFFSHMVAKLMARLRANNVYSDHFLIAMRTVDKVWLGDKVRVVIKDNNEKKLLNLVKIILAYHWHGETITQVQITALHLCTGKQLDLFLTENKINKTIDEINNKYDHTIISYASNMEPIE
jgi:DNA polymerase-4